MRYDICQGCGFVTLRLAASLRKRAEARRVRRLSLKGADGLSNLNTHPVHPVQLRLNFVDDRDRLGTWAAPPW